MSKLALFSKAAEDCRTPKSFALSRPLRAAGASFWSAAVLWRFGCSGFALLLLLLNGAGVTLALPLSDPEVDAYNVRVGTQIFSARYHFTTNTMLLEGAQAIRAMGSDTLKFCMGRHTARTSGVKLGETITNLLTLARDEPSYHQVLDMPFRHFIIWEYPFANVDAPFKDGDYTAEEQASDYRETYDLTRYLLTNYNNSAKTFYLGHWEGDGYLQVKHWTTNPSPAVVQAMIAWENNRQKAVDDAKSATIFSKVSVYYYAEANRVRDAMVNGATNNVRMINAVVPYITNLDYLSYSSYDVMNLSSAKLYETLDYVEAHLPTNKAAVLPGERVWIGEYGWGYKSAEEQEPLNRAYLQRLLNYPGHALPYLLFWELYDNETNRDGSLKDFCLINSNHVKVASYYLHERFINRTRLAVAQFKESHKRLPTDQEFVAQVTPLLDQPLPTPTSLAVSNLEAMALTDSTALVSGQLAQGVYGDEQATVWVFWGSQDGGEVRATWEHSQKVGVNRQFNPAIFQARLAHLTANTSYFFRFYATNASGEAWAPASGRFRNTPGSHARAERWPESNGGQGG